MQQFVDSKILPRANELLKQKGHEVVAMGTPWRLTKMPMRSAGISYEERNHLAQKIRSFEERQQPLQETESLQETPHTEKEEAQEQQKFSVPDPLDLPTRKEILENIPADGLSPQEFNQIFGTRVNPNDTRWYELVRKVAYMDRAEGRWFTLNGPAMPKVIKYEPSEPSATNHPMNQDTPLKTAASAFHRLMSARRASIKAAAPAVVVTRSPASHESRQSTPRIKLSATEPKLEICLKTKPRFNPGDYSTRTVNNTKGFRWRYLEDTTIAERDSMDEIIEIYVEDRIEFDREKKKDEYDIRSQHARSVRDV